VKQFREVQIKTRVRASIDFSSEKICTTIKLKAEIQQQLMFE